MIQSSNFKKTFLEDEVRLGFYIPAAIKKAWAAELEVLRVIDEICSLLGIEYFADWGTFLGAIRHHGFIPWDDDLDIMMRREDYEKFYEKAPSLFPKGFSIHTFRNEEGYREFHAVVVNAEHACFSKEHYDRFHGFNYLCGIDIFILDYVYPNESDEDRRDKEALYLIALADSILEGEISDLDLLSNLAEVERICNVSLKNTKNKKDLWIRLYELAEAKCAEVPRSKSEIMTQMVPWGLKKQFSRRYPKTIYDKTIRIPFENTTIPVPAFYDDMLSRRYGNYMLINKAGGAHDYPYFEKQKKDLEKLLGSKLQDYSFNPDYLNKEVPGDHFKSLLQEGLEQLSTFNNRINTALSANSNSQSNIFDLSLIENDIFSAQELAIDIGNMIENAKGENHPCISYINDYCEVLYHLYNNSLDDISSVKHSFDEMNFKIKVEILDKKVAIFLPFKSSTWNSFDDIYKSLTNNDSYEIYVVPIPYYYKEFDGTLTDEQYDLDSYPKVLNAIPYTDFPIEFMHPDLIFIQNPYDEFNDATSIHPEFYSSKIKNFTDKLIYIPWFNSCEIGDDDFRAYKNMKYFVTVPGVINADITILGTAQERKMYIKKLKEWSLTNIWDDKILLKSDPSLANLGISFNAQSDHISEKSILYYVGAGQSVEHTDLFIHKFKNNLAIFKENEDKFKLTLVIDHLLENTLKQFAPEILDEYQKIITDLSLETNITIQTDNEPVSLLLSCSAYYGDASFIACEYFIAHKPVMIQNYDL